MRHLIAIAMICAVIISSSVSAERLDISKKNRLDKFLDLSFEELFNIDVIVASKREENIYDAPGIINVITAEDIRTYGAQTLFEVLGRLPSVFATGTVSLLDNTVSFRGQADGVTPHMLILFNGRPVREGHTGGVNQHIFNIFPIDVIDRIEVIRGPGSVLYGTYAFSGVINIVTKRAQEELEGVASASYGSFNTRKENVVVGRKKGDFNSYGAFNSINTDGWTLNGTDQFGTTSSGKASNSAHGGFVGADYKGFTFQAQEAYTDMRHFASPVMWPFSKSWRRNQFVDFGYKHNLNEDWDISFNTTYNGYQSLFGTLVAIEENDILFEASVDGKLTDKVNMVGGIVHGTLRGKALSFGSFSKHRIMTKSGYVQVDYKPIASL